jgi:hypothetical protein
MCLHLKNTCTSIFKFLTLNSKQISWCSGYKYCGILTSQKYTVRSWGSSHYNACLTTDWTTGVRSPAGEKDFSSSLCAQTSSEAHPTSYPMGTGGRSPVVERGRGVTLTTQPHLVQGSRMRAIPFTPPWRLHGGSGTLLVT